MPAIDTVLMLRPTESKILFLQQLGRGLRLADGKNKLVVLDFIGNHHSFFHKPQALANVGVSYRELAAFARDAEAGRLALPPGCFVNYDVVLIDFLKKLDPIDRAAQDFSVLKDALGWRPSLAEFYRSGANVARIRQHHGSWFEFVQTMDSLTDSEKPVVEMFLNFLREIETAAMTRSYKMVLLEAFQELDGWRAPPTLINLAQRSWQVLHRRRPLLADLPASMNETAEGTSIPWLNYWQRNPVNAWVGGNLASASKAFFTVDARHFVPTFAVPESERETLATLVQELIDYRLASYEVRQTSATVEQLDSHALPYSTPTVDNVIAFPQVHRFDLPYFPDLKIACGHFRTGITEAVEYRSLGDGHGQLDPARFFLACASGNSMNGGKNPICDGDHLLFELVSPSKAGSITGSVMVIERQDEAGDNQYLLRNVVKNADGTYILCANNPDYEDMTTHEGMRTLARLKAVIDPMELDDPTTPD